MEKTQTVENKTSFLSFLFLALGCFQCHYDMFFSTDNKVVF